MRFMVEEELYEVVRIRRVSEGVMVVMLVFEGDMLRLVCEYAPQSWRTLNGGVV